MIPATNLLLVGRAKYPYHPLHSPPNIIENRSFDKASDLKIAIYEQCTSSFDSSVEMRPTSLSHPPA